jgi:uncharacterized protein Smg (DUF494 family)
MSERVIEIIAYIVNEITTGTIDDGSCEGQEFKLLSQKLAASGYTENEISFAFSWLLEKEKVKNHHLPLNHSHRILHDFEKLAISPEAYGYLIQLYEFDVIDQMEMEQIIEKAMLSNNCPVSICEIKEIVTSTIFRPENEMENSFFLLERTYNVH